MVGPFADEQLLDRRSVKEVAIADCRLDPREQRVLKLVRTALGAHPPPPDQGRHGAGAAR